MSEKITVEEKNELLEKVDRLQATVIRFKNDVKYGNPRQFFPDEFGNYSGDMDMMKIYISQIEKILLKGKNIEIVPENLFPQEE